MSMLTRIEFPAFELDLNEDYKKSFRKRTIKIYAYDYGNEDDHEVGTLTYSIFDFTYVPFYIDDALSESESEDWGEKEFFNWVLKNKNQLEDKILFLGKCIFFQELDINITLINEENLELILETVREEHNIYVSFAAIDTFYVTPGTILKKLFRTLSWKKLTNKYYYKE